MRLVFERPNSIVDLFMSYVIIIDGAEAGRIDTGSTLTLDVSQEEHEIHLKMYWCGSNSVHVRKDVIKRRFRCRNTFSSWKTLILWYIPLVSWYLVTLGRHNYLTLEEEESITSEC